MENPFVIVGKIKAFGLPSPVNGKGHLLHRRPADAPLASAVTMNPSLPGSGGMDSLFIA